MCVQKGCAVTRQVPTIMRSFQLPSKGFEVISTAIKGIWNRKRAMHRLIRCWPLLPATMHIHCEKALTVGVKDQGVRAPRGQWSEVPQLQLCGVTRRAVQAAAPGWMAVVRWLHMMCCRPGDQPSSWATAAYALILLLMPHLPLTDRGSVTAALIARLLT